MHKLLKRKLHEKVTTGGALGRGALAASLWRTERKMVLLAHHTRLVLTLNVRRATLFLLEKILKAGDRLIAVSFLEEK